MWVSVDVEADGPCPGLYSMVSFGAVIVEPGLARTFYAQCAPLPGTSFVPTALAVSGHTREEHEHFPDASIAMADFQAWVMKEAGPRPMFLSDNNGFDWQFINYYFHLYRGSNPFGHSSTNLGSLFKGMEKSTFANFKHLRDTKHTHHPVDDAKGNAEAFLKMKNRGLIIKA